MKTLEHHMNKCEYEYLVKVLRHTKGNIVHACKQSGVVRSQMYRLLRKHRIIVRDDANPALGGFGLARIKGPEGATVIYRPV